MSDHSLKRLVAGVAICLVAVVVAGSVLGSRSVARDLGDRSEAALVAAGLDDVDVDFRGREAELAGGNDVESRLATSLVSTLPGVRGVDSHHDDVRVIPGVARFELDRAGDDVEISGAVPSPDDAAAIKVAVASALRTIVTGDVTVDGSVGRAGWATSLADVLGIVSDVDGLALDVPGDGTVRLGGRVDSPTARAAIVRQVSASWPGLELVETLDVARPAKGA